MICFHEPFGEWWYKGDGAKWPRLAHDSPRIPGLTFDSVWSTIQSALKEKPVFSKDFPHYVEHAWSDDFLHRFNHSFLIRDPAKVITSMFNHWSDFVLKETGILEQRELFDRICDRQGVPPPLIDSDDLLENPKEMTRAFCEAVGISYIPEALHWESGGDPSEHSWWDGGSFHHNLARSTGLTRQARKYVDITECPARVQQVHRRMVPHYERLYAHRIRP